MSTTTKTVKTTTRKVTVVKRETQNFYDDSYFADTWGDFDKAIKNVIQKYEPETAPKIDFENKNECKDVYRKIRTENVSKDLYQSQALQVTDKEDKFQCVMDVKDFSLNDLQVKVVENTIHVDGKFEKVSEDGMSRSSKSFHKEFSLPSSADMENATTALSKDGVLTIKVPKTGGGTPAPCQAVDKSTQQTAVHQSSVASDDSSSTQSTTRKETKTTKTVRVVKRETQNFYDDSFFEDTWGDFDHAVKDVIQKFEPQTAPKMAIEDKNACKDIYRKIRTENVSKDLYKSQANTLTAKDDRFQCVMDVKDFTPNDLQVKVVENKVVVDGKFEKVSEDGMSRSSKSFHKEFTLPSSADLENVSTAMSKDGVLTIKIPKRGSPNAQQITCDTSTPSQSVDQSTHQTTTLQKSSTGDDDTSSTQAVDKSTHHTTTVHKTSSVDDDSSSTQSTTKETKTTTKTVTVVKRETQDFYDDTFFEDTWGDYDHAVKDVIEKYEPQEAPKIKTEDKNVCKDIYRKIRTENVSKDLYQSQANQLTAKDDRFQCVMDVKDFTPNDLQVKVVEKTVVVDGKFEKVSEDGMSSSSKSFHKEFTLPSSADMENVSTAMSKDGVLTIRIPKKGSPTVQSIPSGTSTPSQSVDQSTHQTTTVHKTSTVDDSSTVHVTGDVTPAQSVDQSTHKTTTVHKTSTVDDSSTVEHVPDDATPTQSVDKSTHQTTTVQKSSTADDDTSSTQAVDKSTHHTTTVHKTSSVDDDSSTQSTTNETKTTTKTVTVVKRETQDFYDDTFFEDTWGDYDHAVKDVIEKFEPQTSPKITSEDKNVCKDVYRKIRTENVSKDLYQSQANQLTVKDDRFQCVMDVKDFTPNDVQVKVVENKIVVDGKYEKVSEDGMSSSSKSFHKEFTLPSSADMENVTTAMSKDGVLTIKIPKKGPSTTTQITSGTPSESVDQSTHEITTVHKTSTVDDSSTVEHIPGEVTPAQSVDQSTHQTTTVHKTSTVDDSSTVEHVPGEVTPAQSVDQSTHQTTTVHTTSTVDDSSTVEHIPVEVTPAQSVDQSTHQTTTVHTTSTVDDSSTVEHVPVEVTPAQSVDQSTHQTTTVHTTSTVDDSSTVEHVPVEVTPAQSVDQSTHQTTTVHTTSTVDDSSTVEHIPSEVTPAQSVDQSTHKTTTVHKTSTVDDSSTVEHVPDDVTPAQSVDKSTHQTTIVQKSSTADDDTSSTQAVDKSTHHTTTVHKTSSVDDDSSSTQSTTKKTKTTTKTVTVVKRETQDFYDDTFFEDTWGDYDHAVKDVIQKFEPQTAPKITSEDKNVCKDIYRKIRTENVSKDLYQSQANTLTAKDDKFQCVMDVKDFSPNDLQVKVVENKVIVDGKFEKVSEDGMSSSSKSFHKEFTLPSSADMENVTTAMSKDGVLTIKIPKKVTSGTCTPSQSTDQSTHQTTTVQKSSTGTADDDTSSTQSVDKSTHHTSTVHKTSSVDDDSSSTQSTTKETKTTKTVRVVKRETQDFYDDTFFEDTWGDYDNAVKDVIQKFEPKTAPKVTTKDKNVCKDIYRKIRTENVSKDLYKSQANQLTAKDDRFQCVMDVKDFTPNDLHVKVVENKVIVDGKFEKVSEDGMSSSSKSFHKEFTLPSSADMENVTTAMSKDGVLTIKIPKKGSSNVQQITSGTSTPSQSVDKSTHQTTTVSKSSTADDDSSKQSSTRKETTTTKTVRVVKRETKNFYDDTFFEDTWGDYDTAVKDVIQKFEPKTAPKIATKDKNACKDIYRKIRTENVSKDLYKSQANTLTAKDDRFQCVMDVKDFTPNDLKVKVVENKVVVDGKFEKVSGDGMSRSSKSFHKEFTLPSSADMENVSTAMSKDGVLTIKIPKRIRSGRDGSDLASSDSSSTTSHHSSTFQSSSSVDDDSSSTSSVRSSTRKESKTFSSRSSFSSSQQVSLSSSSSFDTDDFALPTHGQEPRRSLGQEPRRSLGQDRLVFTHDNVKVKRPAKR